MAEVDKSVVLTDAVIDELLDDWFVRDGDTFLNIRKTGRIGWEETLEEGDSYSAYLLEAPTQEDLIKRAYSLAKEMLVVMEPPFKITLRITTHKTGCTDGKSVFVSTKMFDDPELSVGEKLDTFLGVTIHEGCHLLYTDFKEMKDVPSDIVHQIFNILEDERIEELCGEKKPGLANFLEKSKYYYFDHYYLDYVAPKEKKGTLSPFDRILNCFLHIIRYPKYLKEEEIVEFGHYLLAIKKEVLPYPTNTAEAVKVAFRVYEIIKDLYVDTEKERSEREGTGESDRELYEKAVSKLSSDVSAASKALEKIAGSPLDKKHKGELAGVVAKDGELLGETCEGRVDVGATKDSFFIKMPDNKSIYLKAAFRVNRYIPAIAKIMKGHCKEYKLVHRSMRSGILDTNKLAESFQGVPTVYLREGEVKTDKVAVCVLIDESGSMRGDRIKAARDAAVLINEAIGRVPNVELFIYGHSGDMKRDTSTEMFIYREKGYAPRFSLGSVMARSQNRDGIAILETAKRVRKQTEHPVLMFILSDGAPCATAYGGDTAMAHVKECVGKVEKMGFYVIQVCINHCYDPSTMFRNYVVMENMNTLAVELGKAIKRSAMTASKVRVI